MTAAMTPDLLAHVASVRDGACDDNELLVLADRVQEAGDDDRAELIRLCVRSEGAPVRPGTHDVSFRQWKCDTDRIAELLARNPAWLSVECPVCAFLKPGASLRQDCPVCDGSGDVLRSKGGGFLDLTTPTCRATITRGFIDVTLPHTLCWQEQVFDYPDTSGNVFQRPVCLPHPVLRAILASPVGPWVRRVRVEGREPDTDRGDARRVWYSAKYVSEPDGGRAVIPDPIHAEMDGYDEVTCPPQYAKWFPTRGAADDALSLAVPRWARGEG